MADYAKMLSDSVFGTKSAEKQAAVSAASPEKQAVLDTNAGVDPYVAAASRATGTGQVSATPEERTFSTGSPSDILRQFGPDALRAAAAGTRQYSQDKTANRTIPQAVGDTAVGVTQGAANMVGNLGALALGFGSTDAGLWATQQMADLNKALDSSKSDALQQRQRASQVEQKLEQRDSAKEYDADIARGETPTIAGLKQVGRDFVSGVAGSLDDAMVAADGTAQGVGSVLGLGPVARVAGGVGSALVPEMPVLARAAQMGVGGKKVAAAAKVGELAPAVTGAALIGGSEAGGALVQTAQEVLAMPIEELQQKSNLYHVIAADRPDLTPEQIRRYVAIQAARDAAKVAAPAAIAAGALVSKFEMAPGSARSIKGALANAGREFVEEGFQSGTGEGAGNYAIQRNADRERRLSENVGTQAGQGAVYGLGTGGVVQVPGQAANLVLGAGKQTQRALGWVADKAEARAQKIQAKNEASSPVADEVVREAAAGARANAPEAAAKVAEGVASSAMNPEAQAQAIRYTEDLITSLDVDTSEFNDVERAAVGDTTDRVEAIQNVADAIMAAKTGPEVGALAYALHTLLEPVQAMRGRADAQVLDQLRDNLDVMGVIDEYEGLVANIDNTPRLKKALAIVQSQLGAVAESLSNPQTQDEVNQVATVAALAPEKANLEANRIALAQAENGKLILTPSQRSSILASTALLEGQQRANERMMAAGFAEGVDLVSQQITTDESRKGPNDKSALQHTQEVVAAMRAGNDAVASDKLARFGAFVQHMQNKAAAFNEHIAAGNSNAEAVPFTALINGKWQTSPKGAYVNWASQRSIEVAQHAGNEASFLADVFNGLVDAWPELGVDHVVPVTMDASVYAAPASELAQAFRDARKTKPAAKVEKKPAAEPAPKKVEEAPVETAPVQEAAPVETPPVVEEPAAPAAEPTPTTEVVAADDKPATQEIRDEVQAEEPAPTAPATGIEAAYPDLLPTSPFYKAYAMPEAARSRLAGVGDAVEAVVQALRSRADFTAFTGQEIPKAIDKEVARAFQAYIRDDGQEVAAYLNRNLQAALNKKVASGSSKTVGEALLEGQDLSSWTRGRTFALVSQTEDGLAYDSALADSAVLAGLQWNLTSNLRGTVMDSKAVADVLGVDESLVPEDAVTFMQNGLSIQEANTSLAAKIKSYWGVQTNKAVGQGRTEGIASGMASEVLRAMIDAGLIERMAMTVEVPVEVDGVVQHQPRELVRYISTRTMNAAEDVKMGYPQAIDRIVETEPEALSFIGADAIPPVAKSQLRNAIVPNTAEQQAALKHDQATVYQANVPMVNIYQTLGLENVLGLFGAGDLSNEAAFNKNHYQSLVGRNMGMRAGYEHLQQLIGEIDASGVPLADQQVRYAYNFTRTNRMQMLGKHNPQANKLVREAMLPTWATMDMTDAASYGAFMLGVAQGLGIKVHNMSHAKSRAKAEDGLRSEAFAPAREILANAMEGRAESIPADVVPVLKKAFKDAGFDMSVVALHAASEFVRLEGLADADRKSFRTAVYTEADGVTNGPINAMKLLTAGKFGARWVTNMAKGGLFFGAKPRSMNEHRSEHDSVDMYEGTTQTLDKLVGAMRYDLQAVEGGAQHMDALLGLMSEFLPDLTLTEEGTLEMKRGIAKNPLTITIYGSGAAGIAGKVVSNVVDKVYERMTEALARKAADSTLTDAEALFPGANSQERSDRFYAALDQLTSNLLVEKDGDMAVKPNKAARPVKAQSMADFTLQGWELDALTRNMNRMFVGPMVQAIRENVGEQLMDTVAVLRQATQAQSIVLEDQFKKAIAAKLEEKAKDPSWKPTDFLSQSELDGVLKSLKAYHPLMQTGGQNFFIAGSTSSEVEAADLSRSLDNKMAVRNFVYGPKDAGVSGIPFMVIGMGDGQMMQSLSTMDGAPDRNLKIFDGVNFPSDKVYEFSQKANEAVWDSWQGNPMRIVEKAFTPFLKEAAGLGLSQEAAEKLGRALGLGKDSDGKQVLADVSMLPELGRAVADLADQIDARHAVVRRVNVSVDQMAAAAQPYVHAGGAELVGSAQEIADQLNTLYAEELAKVRKAPAPAATPVPEQILALGRAHRTGARVLSPTSLESLRKSGALDEAQTEMLREALGSGSLKGWKFVVGSPEQIAAYKSENGITAGGNEQGLALPALQTVLVSNASAETLVHEAVHAATFAAVLSHYEGTNTQSAVGDAVGNIEKLMGQFLNLGQQAATGNPELAQAYSNATSAIDGWMTNMEVSTAERKAGALNEFMAWSLSNQALGRLLARQQAPKLVQLALDVVKFLKQVFWGKKAAPAVGADAFSNLRFNSAIVMRGQHSLGSNVRDTALFMNTAFGDNERQATLTDAFGKLLQQYGKQGPEQRLAADEAEMLSRELMNAAAGAGFNMTAQEATTFKMMTAAMATAAKVDASALARAAEVHAAVLDKLSPADIGQTAHDLLTGKGLTKDDALGRSTLLPMFLALAMTNDKLRAALAKQEMPKSLSKDGGTLDEALQNLGTAAMDKLQQKMAGENQPANVQVALDQLMAHVAEQAQDRQAFIDVAASHVQGVVGRANEIVMQGMDALGAKAEQAAEQLAKGGRGSKTLASVLTGLSALTTDERAGAAAEGIMSVTNEAKLWKPLVELIGDLVGRIDSNANVYDLIKRIRSAVSQTRQDFRENVPEILRKKFSRELTAGEWNALHHGLARTDIAAVAAELGAEETRKLLSDGKAMTAAINAAEAEVLSLSGTVGKQRLAKAQQLARFMMTGHAGKGLLRNAEAVWRLPGLQGVLTADASGIAAIDKLVSLYAVDELPADQRAAMAGVLATEAAGVDFMVDYLVGQRMEESRKTEAYGRARFNAYKGHVPEQRADRASLVVADVNQHADLLAKSYAMVGDYKGDPAERGVKKAYYFAPVSARAAFTQGMMQNVRLTAGGVDAVTGLSFDRMTAGAITDEHEVARLAKLYERSSTLPENLMPVFAEDGSIWAFERAVDPSMLAKIEVEQDLAQVVGNWRGRQAEEIQGAIMNEALVNAIADMYDAEPQKHAKEYVNLYASKDVVVQDALALVPNAVRAQLEEKFGKGRFMVRRDMVNDVIGYRAASIGDAWTGNTRWNDQTQKAVSKVAMAVMGNDAYRMVVNAEQVLKNAVADAKTIIVVKSMIVPFFNAVSNVYQLVGQGVPIQRILRDTPKKLNEVNQYTKGRVKEVELEAELRTASGNPAAERKLLAQIKALQDSYKRLSIWPLIDAGEFSAISDATIGREEIMLSEGRLQAYMEQLVDKLPDGVRTAGKYALITKDTALFQGLQRAVDYGDFLAKAVIYDDMLERQGLTSEQALGKVTENFVNYDRLPGRFRGGLESLGLMWFMNFKIRSVKVALSMIRNNPVQALFSSLAPQPAGVGTPLQDNLFSAMMDGRLERAIGIGQGLRAPTLNPWWNLTH